MNAQPWYARSEKDILEEFEIVPEVGRRSDDLLELIHAYGFNELKAKKKVNPIILFLNQFHSFIIYILLFAVGISAFTHEYVDAIVILIILLFNAVFGFVQEYKAENAIESLKKLSGLQVKVIRDGKTLLVNSRELVPGDIVIIEEGNKIAADCRILESRNLEVSEASLTGESVPVHKEAAVLSGELGLADQHNMLFSGTTVTRGRAKAIVVATGMSTQIGKIAGLINEAQSELTPLQMKLEKLGKWIGMVTIAICGVVFLVGVAKDGSLSLLLHGDVLAFLQASKGWLLTAVSLAVAAVPEGLPAVVTIALSIGAMKMLKRNALIRHLPSVETLGETTVICSDKTGTLTRNEMTVRIAYVDEKAYHVGGVGYALNGGFALQEGSANDKLSDGAVFMLTIGVVCNEATADFSQQVAHITGDPTEAAFLVSAAKAGLDVRQLREQWKQVGEEPFDSVRKMMSTINVDPKTQKTLVLTKGAPEKVIECCSSILINGSVRTLTKEIRAKLLAKNEEFSAQALRVLAFAYKEQRKGEDTEKGLIFVGMQGMIDPPHEEAASAIARCKEAGIRVIMITGDNRLTAQAIAHEIGILGESMNGADFADLSAEERIAALQKTSIFARVEPAHKMMIVECLQGQGDVVAMTGDGVNDAPAIKKANLGIAMGIAGTDVAKESSEMILQDDNFSSIVNAIEEGRAIFENIRKFVNYLLSCNIGEVLVIFIAILLGFENSSGHLIIPMTAIMLLWMNLVTDGLPALALSVDPSPKNIMRLPPKRKDQGIMGRGMKFNIAMVSVLITAGVISLFLWGLKKYSTSAQGIEHTQTIAFTAIIVLEMVRLQAIRQEYHLGVFSNKWLVLAVATSIGLQLAVIYTPLREFFGTVPLTFIDWGMILGVSVAIFILSVSINAVKSRIAYLND